MQCFLQVSRAVSYKQLIETADATLRQYITHKLPISLLKLDDKKEVSSTQSNYTDFVEAKSNAMPNETENNDSMLHILQESEDTDQIFYDSNETFNENAAFEDSKFIIGHQSLSNSSDRSNNCDISDHKGSLVENVPIADAIESHRKPKQKHLRASDNILSKEPTEWSCYICKKDFPSKYLKS